MSAEIEEVTEKFSQLWRTFSELYEKFKRNEINEKMFLLHSSFLIMNVSHILVDPPEDITDSHLFFIEDSQSCESFTPDILGDDSV